MARNLKVLAEDGQFTAEQNQAGGKLVVADFTSANCPPCQHIAPIFAALAIRFPAAVFLKIDIARCPITSSLQGVTATPTFIFYRNKVKIDTIQGANSEALEARIRQHYGDADDTGSADSGVPGTDTADSGVPGHMDLLPIINKSGCECLNESDDHSFVHALTTNSGYLESDTDAQLILNICFNQAVKCHSLRIKAPAHSGPKTIKVFVNQPNTLDFDGAESAVPLQEINLTPKQLECTELIPLKYVKLQNVSSLTFFVKENQTGDPEEVTQIQHLQIIGSPVITTNMTDFRRVTGKKGESE